MTTRQIKSEINKVLDKVPENALQDILNFLKEFDASSSDQIRSTANLYKILSEDKDLLEKLAK
jgi:hypothetical protein